MKNNKQVFFNTLKPKILPPDLKTLVYFFSPHPLIDVQAKELPCLKVTFLIMSAFKKYECRPQLVSSILTFGLTFLCTDMTRDS